MPCSTIVCGGNHPPEALRKGRREGGRDRGREGCKEVGFGRWRGREGAKEGGRGGGRDVVVVERAGTCMCERQTGR